MAKSEKERKGRKEGPLLQNQKKHHQGKMLPKDQQSRAQLQSH